MIANVKPNGYSSAAHDSDSRHEGQRPEGWDAGYMTYRKEAGLPLEYPPTSQNFPNAGQAFWRDSWDEDAVYVTFDGGRTDGALLHRTFDAAGRVVQGAAFDATVIEPFTERLSDRPGFHAFGSSR